MNEEKTQLSEDQISEINELLNSESIDTTVAMNIIINAVQVSFDKDHFNDLDRMLISKALNSLKEKIDIGEDIIIKVK